MHGRVGLLDDYNGDRAHTHLSEYIGNRRLLAVAGGKFLTYSSNLLHGLQYFNRPAKVCIAGQ